MADKPADEPRDRQGGVLHLVMSCVSARGSNRLDTTTIGPGVDRVDQFTARAAAYVVRIVALYAVLEGRPAIAAGDLDAAYALVTYAVASARHLWHSSDDADFNRLVRAVDARGDGLTRSDVRDLFNRNSSSNAVDAPARAAGRHRRLLVGDAPIRPARWAPPRSTAGARDELPHPGTKRQNVETPTRAGQRRSSNVLTFHPHPASTMARLKPRN